MAVRPRINPTLFDKLAADTDMPGLRDDDPSTDITRDTMRRYSVARLERFNEDALRGTVRRELGWLLNTTNLGAAVDLKSYPHVQTSVLNYGVPDMAGRSQTHRAVMQRAREIRVAVMTFEPRLDETSLTVEATGAVERENAITFVIKGDITSAVNVMPVILRTDLDIDSAAVTVRE
jgi:type VI secretion system protein ImpF